MLNALAAACEGFSGAEIEQAVVASLYTAHSQHIGPGSKLLAAEIAATRPLAVLMAEKSTPCAIGRAIGRLRRIEHGWAPLEAAVDRYTPLTLAGQCLSPAG